jgi:hypothetical protein
MSGVNIRICHEREVRVSVIETVTARRHFRQATCDRRVSPSPTQYLHRSTLNTKHLRDATAIGRRRLAVDARQALLVHADAHAHVYDKEAKHPPPEIPLL